MTFEFCSGATRGVVAVAIIHVVEPHLDTGAGGEHDGLSLTLATHIKGDRHEVEPTVVTIKQRALHSAGNLAGSLSANRHDTISSAVFLQILKVGIGIVIAGLRHRVEQEGLVIDTCGHTHLLIGSKHLSGILLIIIVGGIGTDLSMRQLIAGLGCDAHTTGDMTHGEGDILGGSRHGHPVAHGEVGIETLTGSGIQSASQIAAAPGTEAHGATVLPCERVGSGLHGCLTNLIRLEFAGFRQPVGTEREGGAGGIVHLQIIGTEDFASGIKGGHVVIICILTEDAHLVALIKRTVMMIGDTTGDEGLGHRGTEVHPLPYQLLLLGCQLPLGIVGRTAHQRQGCYRLYDMSYLHLFLFAVIDMTCNLGALLEECTAHNLGIEHLGTIALDGHPGGAFQVHMGLPFGILVALLRGIVVAIQPSKQITTLSGQGDGMVHTVQMTCEHKVLGHLIGIDSDILAQDEIVAMTGTILISLGEFLFPISSRHILFRVPLAIRNGIIRTTVGISTLPTATCYREGVLRIIYTIVVVGIAALFPQARTGTVIVDTLRRHVQIDHRLIVGIQVKLEMLLILQTIVQLKFEVDGIHQFLASSFCGVGLIKHHRIPMGVGGAHDEVVAWCLGKALCLLYARLYQLFPQSVWRYLALLLPHRLTIYYRLQRLHITEVQLADSGMHRIVYQHIGHHTGQTVLQGDGDTPHGGRNLGGRRCGGIVTQVGVSRRPFRH